MPSARRFLLALLLLVLIGAQPAGAQQPAAAGPIYRAAVGGTITSVSTGYLRRALQLAEAANASALVIELSNRGAVLSEARAFAGEIAAAHVPVVVYVTPSGTHAGAAGAISPEFQTFWEQQGGEQQFGPPITGELIRGPMIVQYTRYARLERPVAGGAVRAGALGDEFLRLPGGGPYRWPEYPQ
ncbi:hypothetical protein SE17_16125 [Kouleothrix aurantiaca]|uniref:Serine protease n=1 Tax=Kouleothrix aurantiaca TaxID=186479 RepID=A0A0P9HCT0_9CHLR|nr:hypothetical protein SE17_16125 [Kouleothrix aurantiaca]